MKKLDLVGMKFNKLLVIEAAPTLINKDGRRRTRWLCQCECGNSKIIDTSHLRTKGSNATKSCGCLDVANYSKRAKDMRDKNIKYHPSISSARRVFVANKYKDGCTFEEFYQLSQLPCYYCGAKPNNLSNSAKHDSKKSSQYAKDNGDFYYNGLDRIDSSKDHSPSNVVPCCKWCNYAKRERSVAEFKTWIEQVHKHLCVQKETDSNYLESVSELIQSESLLGSDDYALSTSGTASWVNNGDTNDFANYPTQL